MLSSVVRLSRKILKQRAEGMQPAMEEVRRRIQWSVLLIKRQRKKDANNVLQQRKEGQRMTEDQKILKLNFCLKRRRRSQESAEKVKCQAPTHSLIVGLEYH